MAGPNDREAKVKLTIDLGADGNRAMRELSDSAKAAGAAIKAGMAGGGGGIGGGAGGGGKGPGFWNNAFGSHGQQSGASSTWGQGAAQVGQVARFTTAAMGISNSPFMSQSQKLRGIAKTLPGGETAMGLADTATNRAAFMEVGQAEGGINAISGRQRGEQAAFGGMFNPAHAGRQGLADAYRMGRAITPPSGSRATAEGEREFREQSRLYPLKVQGARAEKESAAAAKERVAAEKELNRSLARSQQLYVERHNLEGDLRKNGGSGVGGQRTLLAIQNNEAERQANANQMRSNAQAAMDAKNKEAAAGANVARNQAAQYGAQAQNLEERAASSATGARKLGGMNPIEQQQAIQALEMVKKYGPQGVPPEMLALAEGIAPETVGKLREGAGAKGAAFGQLSKLAPADYAGDPEKLRQQAADARKNEAEKLYEADKSLSATAASAGKEFAAIVEKAMTVMFDSMRRDFMNNIKLSKSQ